MAADDVIDEMFVQNFSLMSGPHKDSHTYRALDDTPGLLNSDSKYFLILF